MPTTTRIHAAHVGVSHRQGGRDRQQDAVLTTPDAFVVADGFGDRDDLAQLALEHFVGEGYVAAVTAVGGAGASGTTLTGVELVDGTARITHVGDARVHLVRDGDVRRLTADHTIVAGLIEAGELTEAEARSHPHRMLLNRALGGDAGVAPDESQVEVQYGDRLVLTTDGVHAVLDPDALTGLLLGPEPAEEVAAAIGDAVERAGEPDNHTVIVVDLEGRDRTF